MNFKKFGVPVIGVVVLFLAWRSYSWAGLALVGGGMVMFLLLHFNRAMGVLKRAADAPVGYVGSAVMLNARLKPNVTLMHVIAMTRALGELRSQPDTQPEHYRWSDTGGSYVDAIFKDGKLQSWVMTRPDTSGDDAADGKEGSAS